MCVRMCVCVHARARVYGRVSVAAQPRLQGGRQDAFPAPRQTTPTLPTSPLFPTALPPPQPTTQGPAPSRPPGRAARRPGSGSVRGCAHNCFVTLTVPRRSTSARSLCVRRHAYCAYAHFATVRSLAVMFYGLLGSKHQSEGTTQPLMHVILCALKIKGLIFLQNHFNLTSPRFVHVAACLASRKT